MSLLKEIPDKGAVLAWSPVAQDRNIIALGTKDAAGAGFDDYGGTLELHSLDFSDPHNYSTSLLGTAQTESRFSSLAWSDMSPKFSQFEHGVIAGGMLDGSIHFWDASRLVNGDEDARMASIQQHNGSVNGLQFNPHRDNCHLLASGGSDGEIFVTSIERPDEPNVFIPAPGPAASKHTAEITKVAWNTQVQHILASSAQNGSCIVWDLRQKKAWCELKDPQQAMISDIAWHPGQGLHLVTAMGDDRNPVIKLWDLRSSTSLPLATLQGHTQGVLSVSWCPADPSLLMSCGKDNRTLLWDLFHLEPVYELPSFAAAEQFGDSSSVFGGAMGAGGAGRRYHVEWSPKLPAMLSACSFDRRVQVFSLTGAKSSRGRAPSWLRRPVGASFGFGGKLATFNYQPIPAGPAQPRATVGPVRVQSIEDSPEVVTAAEQFEQARQAGAFKEWCDTKAASAQSPQSQQVWRLMKVLCFETNAREQLLAHLGFDAQAIAAEATEFIEERKALNERDEAPASTGGSGSGSGSSPRADSAAESTIRRALMVGNFQAAVDACFESNMMAEALLLASCGGAELWASTQAKYFEREARKRPFLHLLSAIIKTDLSELVQNSDLAHWQETLAVLSTYAKTEEFGPLCAQLGKRLAEELNDKASATLCYMCAVDIRQTALYWIEEFKEACARAGMLDTMALQDFIEKVIVFREADPNTDLGAECAEMFVQYAELLASQGKLDIAAKYAIGNAPSIAILRDRLYHAGAARSGMQQPASPFERKVVGGPAATSPKPAASGATPAAGATPARKPSAGAAAAAAHAAQSAGTARPVATQAQGAGQAAAGGATVPATATLPPGWIMLVEPNSGRPYFVNQATGVSQWEPPAGTVFPQQQQQATTPAMGTAAAAAHAFAGAAPAGGAAAGVAHPLPSHAAGGAKPFEPERKEPEPSPRTVTPPASATPASPAVAASPAPKAASTPTSPVAVSEDVQQVVGPLQALLDSLGAANLSGMERKQLPEIQKALTLLSQRMMAGEVAADVVRKVVALGHAMHARDYHTADSIVQDLVTNAWMQHKDWIKSTKFLYQLASKKL